MILTNPFPQVPYNQISYVPNFEITVGFHHYLEKPHQLVHRFRMLPFGGELGCAATLPNRMLIVEQYTLENATGFWDGISAAYGIAQSWVSLSSLLCFLHGPARYF